jgi:hypothetical protein
MSLSRLNRPVRSRRDTETRHTSAEAGGATVTLSFDDREFDSARTRSQQIAIRVAVGDASTDRPGWASEWTPPARRAKEDLEVPRRQ